MFSSGWARFAHQFTNYYRNSPLWSPPRTKFREWMFIPFGNTPPIRHKAFSDIEGVRSFITQRPMHSCFYSTAYWHKPYELKMANKDWIGADLIFDLDGDHLPGVTDRDFPAMLEVIQEQAFSLWNDYLEPEFGFNLHDQSSYYTAGNNFKTATISFLAPAYNYEKEINEVRSNTMKVIVDLNNELSKIIPGHIGRYSDDFEPRAFGDNLVKWGTSSVLIESGGWKDDAEKQFIRKLNFISLLVAFESIAKGNYNSNNIDYYFAIPQNERLLYDVILRNALIEIHGKEFLMDVAINRNERINRNGEKTYYSSISELGDLSIFYGYEEYDLSNMKLEPGKIYKDDYYHELEKEDLTELLNDGFTDFLSDTLYVKEIDLRKTKVNLFTDKERKSTNEIRLFRNANFVVKKDDQVKYLFINGFLVNPKVDFTTVENGLLID